MYLLLFLKKLIFSSPEEYKIVKVIENGPDTVAHNTIKGVPEKNKAAWKIELLLLKNVYS